MVKIMEETILYAIGIDFSTGFSSLSYVESKNAEPKSMSISADDGKYVIPLVLYKRKQTDEWLIGDEAFFASENEENGRMNLVNSLFEIYVKNETKYIENREYTGEELMKLFFVELYRKAKGIIGFSSVENLVITTETINRSFVQTMKNICASEEIKAGKIQFLNHSETFAYYVLHSKRELWANDVTLFSLDEKGFICRNLTKRREKNRNTIFVETEDLSWLLQYENLQSAEGQDGADEKFSRYLSDDYKNHIVSSVFFTGIGFYENWYQKSIREICRKRRAFKGFNLYADGAAVSTLKNQAEEWAIYCEGRTSVNVAIQRLVKGQKEDYLLSPAGVTWTEAGNTAEFILDHADHVSFVITAPFHKDRELFDLSLQEFPLRDDKTMCIAVSLEYDGSNYLEITVEDRGFGDFIKPSGKVIRKRISL